MRFQTLRRSVDRRSSFSFHDSWIQKRWAPLVLTGTFLGLSACVLAPHGTDAERARLAGAGATFEVRIEERAAPELSRQPDWHDLLRYAFLTNGELEAAYFEWKAALERVAIESGYPNTNVMVNFGYLFSDEKIKGWDRTMWNIGFDPMQNLSSPTKVAATARVALAEARAAGHRFQAVKFQLQRRVLNAYIEYALLEQKRKVQADHVELLGLALESARARLHAGAAQQDLLRAEIEQRLARNELANLVAEMPRGRAMLNGLLGRDPNAPLDPPAVLPSRRPIGLDDATLIKIAAEHNPQLSELADRVAGKKDALDLARQQYLPDINPFLALTGGIEQVVGGGVVFATTIPQIRARVREARAMLQANEAMLRQARSERTAHLIASLLAIRNSERQTAVFENDILPATELAARNFRQAYAAGYGSFLDLVESERTLLDVRLSAVEARASRERFLAELEELLGVDLETLDGAHLARRGQ